MDMNPVTEILVLSIIAAAVILASHKILKLYSDWNRLPPGPFPWPVVGNILWFRQNNFPHEVMNEIAAKYGPVFSLFLGHNPHVVVADPEIGLQVLKKYTFAGRPRTFLQDNLFFKGDSTDIVFSDYGTEWEALRKVGHSATRKYAVSPQLAPTVIDVVDRAIERVMGESFDCGSLVNLIMPNILAMAAFGERYDFDDPEFLQWTEALDVSNRRNGVMILVMFMPFMRHIFYNQWKDLTSSIRFQWDYVEKMYQKRLESYSQGKTDTFCDAVITAKIEAEAEENWMLPYLKPRNVMNTITDLFGAGVDTTKMSLKWVFLLMAKYPDLQEQMRREVIEAVSGGEPQLDHKSNCSLVCAFVSETLRFRHINPTGVPHKAVVDSDLCGYKIPKGTTVIILLNNALKDEKVWGDPEVFRPDRFLDTDGTFVSKPNHLYIPFSDGRRSCFGNKLAFNTLFLIVARLLMKTRNIEVVGGVTETHMRGDLSKISGFRPTPFHGRLTLSQSDS